MLRVHDIGEFLDTLGTTADRQQTEVVYSETDFIAHPDHVLDVTEVLGRKIRFRDVRKIRAIFKGIESPISVCRPDGGTIYRTRVGELEGIETVRLMFYRSGQLCAVDVTHRQGGVGLQVTVGVMHNTELARRYAVLNVLDAAEELTNSLDNL